MIVDRSGYKVTSKMAGARILKLIQKKHLKSKIMYWESRVQVTPRKSDREGYFLVGMNVFFQFFLFCPGESLHVLVLLFLDLAYFNWYPIRIRVHQGDFWIFFEISYFSDENLSHLLSYPSYVRNILLYIMQNLGIFKKCTISDVLSNRVSEPGSDLRFF